MKIATWNVNSINARLEILIPWLKKEDPDILLLQELKCTEENFPYEAFNELPYELIISGQKAYNGVAILSKFASQEKKITFENNPHYNEARFLEVKINTPLGKTTIISLYAPNGGEVKSEKYYTKLKFFEYFQKYLKILLKNKKYNEFIIVGGDFNIAKEEIDVCDPEKWQHNTAFTMEERRIMRSILNIGFTDLFRITEPKKQEFTWYDYRKKLDIKQGLRIDYIIASTNTCLYLHKFDTQKNLLNSSRPSDHVPCIAHLEQIKNLF